MSCLCSWATTGAKEAEVRAGEASKVSDGVSGEASRSTFRAPEMAPIHGEAGVRYSGSARERAALGLEGLSARSARAKIKARRFTALA